MIAIWNFVVNHGLYNYVVAWAVGLVLGGIFLPAARRMWKTRKSELSQIVDLLSTETAGGLAELKVLIEEILERM